MVERLFRDLIQNRLRRGIFRDVEELISWFNQAKIEIGISRSNASDQKHQSRPSQVRLQKEPFHAVIDLVGADLSNFPGLDIIELQSSEIALSIGIV